MVYFQEDNTNGLKLENGELPVNNNPFVVVRSACEFNHNHNLISLDFPDEKNEHEYECLRRNFHKFDENMKYWKYIADYE